MPKEYQTKETKKANKVMAKPIQKKSHRVASTTRCDKPVIAKTSENKAKCGKKPRDLAKAEEETNQKKRIITIKHAYLRTFAIRLNKKNEELERLKIPDHLKGTPHGSWLRSKLKNLQN